MKEVFGVLRSESDMGIPVQAVVIALHEALEGVRVPGRSPLHEGPLVVEHLGR